MTAAIREVLVGIVRSDGGLHVRSARMEREPGVAGPSVRVELVERPLEATPEALVPVTRRFRLLGYLGALERASPADPGTLASLLALVVDTVPRASPGAPVWPVPERWVEPPPPRATAAHPRAFRGTRHRPPKPQRPAPLDLRPILGNTRHEHALVRSLVPLMPAAIERLAALGYDPAGLARVAALPPDLAFAYHAGAADPPRLPAPFTLDLLPALRGAPRRVIAEHLALYRALELEAQPALLARVSRLLAEHPDARTLGWLRAAAEHPPELRESFVGALLAASFGAVHPASLPGLSVPAFLAVTPPEHHARWLFAYLGGLRAGVDAAYLLEGLRLAAACPNVPDLTLLAGELGSGSRKAPVIPPADDFPADVAAEVVAHLGAASPAVSLELWARSGQLPGFADILRQGAWRTMEREVASLFLDVFGMVVHHDPEGPALQAKWEVIRREAPGLARLVHATASAYRLKLLEGVKDALFRWDDPAALASRLPAVLRLASRLARAPFREEGEAVAPMLAFLEGGLNEAGIEGLLAAPDASFKALEAACRRDNDARLVELGLPPLATRLGDFALACFRDHPAALFRAAQTLGCLLPASRRRVVEALAAHPLLAFDPATRPLAEVCALVRRHRAGRSNPIPRRLREHLDGAVTLTGGQLRGHAARVAARLGQTRLELLEELVLDDLSRGLPVPGERAAHRHALQMIPWSDGNRRALRRFLRAHWSGDAGYLRSHPVSRAWLARHPALPADLWTEGVELGGQTASHGPVRVALERDPLEVFKLGSYVGSCLGLGGICSYSAAAVVLDVNKQVLYARGEAGQVLARQLVAISTRGELVCFEVYPQSVAEDVKALFFACDRHFAEALGVPLAQGDDYRIDFVLAREWWDDGGIAPPVTVGG